MPGMRRSWFRGAPTWMKESDAYVPGYAFPCIQRDRMWSLMWVRGSVCDRTLTSAHLVGQCVFRIITQSYSYRRISCISHHIPTLSFIDWAFAHTNAGTSEIYFCYRSLTHDLACWKEEYPPWEVKYHSLHINRILIQKNIIGLIFFCNST